MFQIHPWKVIETGWEPAKMPLGESLTCLGNGYMGLRGNFEEDYSGDTHRGTYLGGVWFPDKTRVGWWKNGYPAYFGKVINAVNLIGIHVEIDGELLDLNRCQVADFTRAVDMYTGVMERKVTAVQPKGSVEIKAQRFVSTAVKELLALRYELTYSWEAHLKLTPYLDGDVRNLDANYEEAFWDQLDAEECENACGILMQTKANPFGAPQFTVGAAMAAQCGQLTRGEMLASPGLCALSFEGIAKPGEAVVLDKFSFVVTSRDHKAQELLKLALAGAEDALAQGYAVAADAHRQGWKEHWDMADVTIEGDDAAQQGIRFNLFHLLSTYTGEDARLNIGPKGFTGEKYGGATYWDTEAYCLPVYMAVAGDKVARQLLQYRYDQLEGAYHNAKQQGLEGALYPMVTFTGVECHNEWEITFEEIHRNGAIAHAIFEYTAYTGDHTYELGQGLEVLLGIA
ncbi:MAG: glycoside hydrolase family 65 protein, partial [Clostridia bacterium]|nr:glycoside hydrolase family 65 protein [Clostridia bacterium]